MTDYKVSEIETNGISILEKWIQETFMLFGEHGVSAKANIPILFRELDDRSAKTLKSCPSDDLVALFIASLRLFEHQDITIINISPDDVRAQSLADTRQCISTLILDRRQNFSQKDIDNEVWSIIRPDNISNHNSLQQVLIAFSALAFVPEFIEYSGIGGFDRKTYESLDGYVSPLCYPNNLRIKLRYQWNMIQSANRGSYTI